MASVIRLSTVPIAKIISVKNARAWVSMVSLSKKIIQEATGEKLSTFYLMQSISMAIQRGNAASVRGCPKRTSSGLEGLFNFHVQEAEML